jgi:hypothetical protein
LTRISLFGSQLFSSLHVKRVRCAFCVNLRGCRPRWHRWCSWFPSAGPRDGIGSPAERRRADHRCAASNRTAVVHSPGWKRRATLEVDLDLLARVGQRR